MSYAPCSIQPLSGLTNEHVDEPQMRFRLEGGSEEPEHHEAAVDGNVRQSVYEHLHQGAHLRTVAVALRTERKRQ